MSNNAAKVTFSTVFPNYIPVYTKHFDRKEKNVNNIANIKYITEYITAIAIEEQSKIHWECKLYSSM